MALWSRLLLRSPKSRGSATSVPTRSVRITVDLYIDDMRASMSVKKVAGAGSPIARRWRFRGTFKKRDKYRSRDRVVRAHNNAKCTGVFGGHGRQSTDRQSTARPCRTKCSPARHLFSAGGRCRYREIAAVAHGRFWHDPEPFKSGNQFRLLRCCGRDILAAGPWPGPWHVTRTAIVVR